MTEVLDSIDNTNVHLFDVFELTSQWQSQIPTSHWTPRLATLVIQMLVSSIVSDSPGGPRSCPVGIHYRGFTEDSDCSGNRLNPVTDTLPRYQLLHKFMTREIGISQVFCPRLVSLIFMMSTVKKFWTMLEFTVVMVILRVSRHL